MIAVKHAECPHCHRSFMNEANPIKGKPCIAIHGKLPDDAGGKEGAVRLSSHYGDFTVELAMVIPDKTIVKFTCPFCAWDLTSSRICEVCDAPMVALQMGRGGILQFCSRRGCRKHLIEFEDPEADLKAFYEEYSPYMG